MNNKCLSQAVKGEDRVARARERWQPAQVVEAELCSWEDGEQRESAQLECWLPVGTRWKHLGLT